MGILTPTQDGQTLHLHSLLNSPTWIEQKFRATLDGSMNTLEAIYQRYGDDVAGGALAHTVFKPADQYLKDEVAERSPGGEYKVVDPTDPETRLAKIRDWGGKISFTDEERRRNRLDVWTLRKDQLLHTLARKITRAGLTAFTTALDEYDTASIAASTAWDQADCVGPQSNQTPGPLRPFADIARAQAASDYKFTTLLTSRVDAANLKVAYGAAMKDELDAAGLALQPSGMLEPGTAYLLSGTVGYIAFEQDVTTEVWDDRHIRSTWVQCFCMPAFAVTEPHAVTTIVGTRT